MSFWVLLQVLVNLILLAGVGFVWFRLQRPAKDDPRLSRGLQLLQSKIAVLEDLSDRTETQVQQLTHLLEQKVREVQSQCLAADKQIQQIDSSMGRSMEVAKIFQDKIPHQEIIERQNTVKYVKAARMAHAGASVDEISQSVDLSRGEIEFIAKVNRDQLQFSESELPAWALDESMISGSQDVFQSRPPMESVAISTTAAATREDRDKEALSELGQKFRQALNPETSKVSSLEFVETEAKSPAVSQTRVREMGIRKFEFPKIDISKNLG